MSQEKISSSRSEVKRQCPEIIPAKEINVEPGTLILLVGPPASGKSTFAAEHFPVECVVSSDYLRSELTNNPGNHILSDLAFARAGQLVASRMKQGRVTVVDAMNLRPNARKAFIKFAAKNNRPVIGVHFDFDPAVLQARDLARGGKVGEKAIGRRAGKTADIIMLQNDKNLDELYVVDQPDQEVTVNLPKAEQALFETEKDFYFVATKAETDFFEYGRRYKERLKDESLPRLEVQSDSVNFITDSPEARTFLQNNTIPTQVIDLEFLVKRFAVPIDDPLVIKTAERFLRHRYELNLVTFVLVSDKTSEIAAQLKEIAGTNFEHTQSVDMDSEQLKKAVISIDRGELKDEPLLILGDIHGSLQAMQKMRQEVILEKKDFPDLVERKMVLVGDVPDRGPFNAQSLLYAANLVKRGKAEWILGNHDENVRIGLQIVWDKFSESDKDWATWIKEDFKESMLRAEVRSRATRQSIKELIEIIDIYAKGTMKKQSRRPRISKNAFKELLDTMNAAPIYKEWRHLVAVHASLPHIPKEDEELDDKQKMIMTHGKKMWLGPSQENLKLRTTTATNPDIIVVGGHTHDREVTIDYRSGTVGLDVTGPTLHALKYPEMEVIKHDEPHLVELFEMAKNPELPSGEKLWQLVNFFEDQLMLKLNSGKRNSEYEGLTIISYHELTEVNSTWEKFPVLRNFRGLIIDRKGNIVARPFKKTHKTGIEISLDQLDFKPEKVFEKVNGSMGICYFHGGQWRIATKFSFHNPGYTVPATEMLEQMNTNALDKNNTYLFEIILPEDPHVVDYEGRKELVLLNSNITATGADLPWQKVADTAKALGCRTAYDLTDQFEDLTIAEIYQKAQTEGELHNLEGLMAIYHDHDTGEQVTVKVKAIEYDNKKFVRDRMKWDKLLDRFDWEKLEMSDDDKDLFMSYKRDSEFVVAALETRLEWIRDQVKSIIENFIGQYKDIIKASQLRYLTYIRNGESQADAITKSVNDALVMYRSAGGKMDKEDKGVLLSFIRSIRGGQNRMMIAYAKKKITTRIQTETAKRGQASFWLLPE
ncbi:hypothetical protein COT97_04205 [Candidatus Falkowbacteria bacterium CG10_big_fil_rev_8_21_14_0_10_39_11]|uniref:Calcineurin-like phosphoesterase domain-containing protein n=1 Tax=Candidatus Falkowbacteria bacterium CG10_big_fil_rev_8_21_14_0_10_39_11 TaxID=1974565 RepID=A0A2H0V659_9BACT|nr:MAG: hypothetical protein COT97_04205 [Candidatus Falkowbacteria bacterium CG10_big_fil_rev_8_21_14_0_10_39_11]